LEGGADVIRELGQFCFPFAVDQENKPPDGIGTPATVIQDFRKIGIASLDNVLFESAKEIEKKGVGKIKFGFGLLKGFKDPGIRTVVFLAFQRILPGLAVGSEDLEPLSFGGGGPVRFLAGIGITFIGQIVGHPSKSINGMDMGSEFRRNESSHREVFIVLSGQLAAGGIGVWSRDRKGIGCGDGRLHHLSIFTDVEGRGEPTSVYPNAAWEGVGWFLTIPGKPY
jgi:hypothetical protein